jgi:hypothetical protein
MAHQPRPNYPSSAAEFLQRFPNNQLNTVHSVAPSIARASGSRWSVAHLEACRVILLPPEQANEHLEILRPYRERARIHIENFPEILRSLTAVSPKNLKEYSSARLRKIGGEFGAFYSRLAEVVRMPQPVRRTRPERDIRQPYDPNFVTGEGLGFSSPLGTEASTQFQSSPFSLSESDPVEQSDHELRKKHETVTASMAAEFISAILDICSD